MSLSQRKPRERPRYWLTPPELDYLREGKFDPTPYPHAFGDRNALLTHWEKPWYLNPPFHQQTRFVRKAIAPARIASIWSNWALSWASSSSWT